MAIGEVISKSDPKPQFGTTTYQNGMIMPPKMVVDVMVRIFDEVVKLQDLPAEASIADSGSGMVVSESRDAIISEINGYKMSSQRSLDEMPRHQHIVEQCDVMLSELNPQLKKEAEQSAEIENLKKGMADLQDTLGDLRSMLTEALKGGSKNE